MTVLTGRLSPSRKLGYGVGDFGFNLFFTTSSLYLLYYYTDVLGLSPAAGGWIFAIALLSDALFDPFMGYVANRTRTRWGRYRPYILFGGIPLAASWVLIFLPTGFTGTALFLFALAAHMLFRMLYAVVSMPYLALTAVITDDSRERGELAGIRMVSAALCGLVAAFFTLKLVAALGGGQTGFLWAAMLYAILAYLVFLLVFVSTAERVAVVGDPPDPGIREMIAMLRGNTLFWLVAAAMLCASIGGTMFTKTLPYYFKYALGRGDLIGGALTALTGAVALSIPVWLAVMKRTSKRTMWLSGIAISLVSYSLLWLAPLRVDLWIPLLALAGFGAGSSYLGFWSTIPDTIEYGEWRSGIRAEGAVFGVVSLIQKGSLGIAAAVLGELLQWSRYAPNAVQTPATLAAMKLIMLGLPFAFAVAGLAAVYRYPLDHRMHRKLRRGVERRRAQGGMVPKAESLPLV